MKDATPAGVSHDQVAAWSVDGRDDAGVDQAAENTRLHCRRQQAAIVDYPEAPGVQKQGDGRKNAVSTQPIVDVREEPLRRLQITQNHATTLAAACADVNRQRRQRRSCRRVKNARPAQASHSQVAAWSVDGRDVAGVDQAAENTRPHCRRHQAASVDYRKRQEC